MADKCRVPGCEVMIFGGAKICGHHWHRVPKPLQDALQRIGDDDENYASVLAACVDAAGQSLRAVSERSNGYPRGSGM
jgi:hypothetical protein